MLSAEVPQYHIRVRVGHRNSAGALRKPSDPCLEYESYEQSPRVTACYTWGFGSDGQLGHKTVANYLLPWRTTPTDGSDNEVSFFSSQC